MKKPMLAHTIKQEDVEHIQYPVLCSAKLNGIRCIVKDGVVYSRTMKPIRSKSVQ